MAKGSISRITRFGRKVYVPRLADGLILGYFDTEDEAREILEMAEAHVDCPKTGRSASVCDAPDHRNCPNLVR